ncbi:hypothetical protein PJM41_0056 [Salmonella phage vB_SenS_UTK0009]|uniref:Uncharacterized protein n=1 Tax=Salmonella phage vB_SenS_UTK0009 TaxID=3028908 RepID=A0AAF0CCW1_9CAUD|nr:hypothetical protein PJM41_0056 [Salmonella phage vB_SenS_UTK0009]
MTEVYFDHLHDVVENTPLVEEMVIELSARAQNRHHRQRLKNKRMHYWNAQTSCKNNKRMIGKVTTTPCLCSCCMCMSPRKLYGNSKVGLKISEIRKMEAMIMGISNDEFDGFATQDIIEII